MSPVSDILKILDQIPIWRTLKALPGRFDALEARVAELEAAVKKPTKTPGEPCPACGDHALRRTSSKESAVVFSALGARDEIWTCQSCGAEDERLNVR